MASTKRQTAAATPEETAVQPRPIDLDVRINSIVPPNGDNKLRATGSVSMNGCFAVRGVKVFDGPKGLFVNMPSYKAANGEYRDFCHPVTKEFREQLNNAVLDAYKQASVQGQSRAEHDPASQDAPGAHPIKVDVRITAITPSSEHQRASATVNLNDSFALKGVRIMEGTNGRYVSTPSFKSGDEYKEHYFPTTKEFREKLHGAVLNAYDEAIAQSQSQASAIQDYSPAPAYAQTM